jgi:hypothetical protein
MKAGLGIFVAVVIFAVLPVVVLWFWGWKQC